MSVVLITGSCGLIGSESVKFFSSKGFDIVGIDNNSRAKFFGKDGDTNWVKNNLVKFNKNYNHKNTDIRNYLALEKIFKKYKSSIKLIIHSAAQPSHDWAKKEPFVDFNINALGTLNLLSLTKKYSDNAPFIFLSTNKVYGDLPNTLPLVEHETRWELESTHPYYERGINESMSIDDSTHSLFGVSKAGADLLVQEYGRNFGIKTACFRGGCLTGSLHSGTKLHGFLSYLMICAMKKQKYTVIGFKGKQVRDNIHSKDLVKALYAFYKNPRVGKVYNIGGGRFSNCSVLEAISLCKEITGNNVEWSYEEKNRIGDHIWWISDCSRFQNDYPEWKHRFGIKDIFEEIHEGLRQRL